MLHIASNSTSTHICRLDFAVVSATRYRYLPIGVYFSLWAVVYFPCKLICENTERIKRKLVFFSLWQLLPPLVAVQSSSQAAGLFMFGRMTCIP